MLRSIAMLPLIAFSLLPAACLKGGFLMKGSDCPEGQVRTGGSMCVPATAESTKLGAISCKDPDLAALKVGVEVTMCDGSVGVGTFAACTEDGQVDCAATADFPVVKKSNLFADKIALGTTIAGITGTKRDIKQCRNAAHLATFDANSVADTDNIPATANGIVDPWDTVTDSNGGLGISPSQGPWGAQYVCDSSNFTNVSSAGFAGLTPTGGSVGGNRNFTQIWRDELTGLYFSNILCDWFCMNWQSAMSMCNNLNSGDGVGNWRLPTEKELMQLYVNGISRLVVDGGNFGGGFPFWTSSALSFSTDSARVFSIAEGNMSDDYRYNSYGALCVR